MSDLERLGRYDSTDRASSSHERDLFLLRLEDHNDLPERLPLPSENFVGLLVWDSDLLAVEEIDRVVSPLLTAGCVSFWIWGKGCERVHDIIDETVVMRAIDRVGEYGDDEPLIFTAWVNDPLDEALFDLLCCSDPDEAFEATTLAAVVLTIGAKPGDEQRVRYALSEPSKFIRAHCRPEITGLDLDRAIVRRALPWVVLIVVSLSALALAILLA